MVLLTAFVAVTYAFALLPFKTIPVIEGFVTVRPANFLPVVYGLLFGPAAAWGSMLGNVAGDILGGTWSAGSYFGAVGNFATAFVTYRLWGNLGRFSDGGEPDMRSGEKFAEYLVVILVSASVTAAVIGWGHEVVSLLTFSSLGVIIFFNNTLTTLLLGPPVLYLVYPEVKKRGWLYHQIMPDTDLPRMDEGRMRKAAVGISVVSVVWLVVGVAVGFAVHGLPPALVGGEAGAGGAPALVAVGAVGFTAVVLLSALSGERLSRVSEP